MSETFDRPAFTSLIDTALREFAGRELLSGSEVCDVLLDLRLTVLSAADASADPLAELLDALSVPR